MTLSALELVGIITVCVLLIGVGTKVLLSKLTDFREILDRDIRAVANTSDRNAKELEHDLKNERMRIDQLQQQDLDKEKRLLKLESAVTNIEKSQDRTEKMVERGFADLTISIRDLRSDVKS